MRRGFLSVLVAAICFNGCTILEPEPPLAELSVSIETDRSMYNLCDPILVDITNLGHETVNLDCCSYGTEGWYDHLGGWKGSYGTTPLCANFADVTDVLASMARIGPQETFGDTLSQCNGSTQAAVKWRVWYQFLDARGSRLSNGRRTSDPFCVYRILRECDLDD